MSGVFIYLSIGISISAIGYPCQRIEFLHTYPYLSIPRRIKKAVADKRRHLCSSPKQPRQAKTTPARRGLWCFFLTNSSRFQLALSTSTDSLSPGPAEAASFTTPKRLLLGPIGRPTGYSIQSSRHRQDQALISKSC